MSSELSKRETRKASTDLPSIPSDEHATNFVFEIENTPDMYPANLGFIFQDGQYYGKLAITWPSAYRNAKSWPICIGLFYDWRKPMPKFTMYVAKQSIEGRWVARHDANAVPRNSVIIEELSQDLRAVGYTAESNPELAEILNVRPPVTTTA